MHCLKCGCSKSTKAGFTRNLQRYKCSECSYYFTTDKLRGKSIETKKNAIHLYLEGMGIRAIARFLKVSNVAVLKWIRRAGEIIQSMHHKTLTHKTEAQIIEMDELHHYIQKKGVHYGFGWLLTEFENKLLPFKLVAEESKQVKVFIIK